MSKQHFILSYDITDDKNRRKMAETLEGYGVRVQYSVFEAWLGRGQLGKLTRLVEPFINAGQGDSLKIYTLCASCYPKHMAIGGFVPEWTLPIILGE